mmetsp:Transcript_44970/g.104037  ORF Transcript_44970/g.104037 Transcript_44970/m.104037 type:complete len:242 (+) Transcript_44970:95-820(+)
MAPGTYHAADPVKHTLQPIVTGAAVLGIKYAGGVLVACDTLASYGSQARYKDFNRLKKVGKFSLIGASGEISDFQYLGQQLDEEDLQDFLHEDGYSKGPKEYSSYMGRVMYNRRSRMNPLYMQLVVAGKKGADEPFLGYVDHQGTTFEDNYVATGFGSHLAMPLMRKAWRPDITLGEAKELLKKCLEVLWYRDCKAYCRIRFGYCDANGVTIEDPIQLEHNWNYKAFTEERLTGANISATW